MSAKAREQLVLLGLVIVLLLWMVWEARTFPERARIFPQLIASFGLLLACAELVRTIVVHRRALRRAHDAAEAIEANGTGLTWMAQFVAGIPYLLWVLGYYVAIYLIGFLAASFAFVMAFLVTVARMRWYTAAAATAVFSGLLMLFGFSFRLTWPRGALFTLLGVG